MAKINKSIWGKLTRLDENVLSAAGCEIEITKKEKPAKIKEPSAPVSPEQSKEEWLPQISEGKLSIDVYLDDKNIVVVSAIAGVKSDDLEILIDRDVLTLKGERKNEIKTEKKNYLHQECFWGSFSRTVLLPCEVKTDEVKANLKNGILTVILPIKGDLKDEEYSSRVKVTKK